MASENGVPDVAEELNRKTVDALFSIANQHREGEVSSDKALYAVRAIFDITSGLTGRDVHDLIAEFVEMLEEL